VLTGRIPAQTAVEIPANVAIPGKEVETWRIKIIH